MLRSVQGRPPEVGSGRTRADPRHSANIEEMRPSASAAIRLFSRFLAVVSRALARQPWRQLRPELEAAYADYLDTSGSVVPRTAWVCLIAGEDHRFQTHLGVDFVELWHALRQGMKSNRWRGASTIEMQLVRTLTGRRERTLRRKWIEILLALRVREVIPKSDIPGVYLHVAPFGGDSLGIQSVCAKLGYHLSQLPLDQAAEVVARLRYPDPDGPSTRRRQQISRQVQYILAKVEQFCFGGNH